MQKQESITSPEENRTEIIVREGGMLNGRKRMISYCHACEHQYSETCAEDHDCRKFSCSYYDDWEDVRKCRCGGYVHKYCQKEGKCRD